MITRVDSSCLIDRVVVAPHHRTKKLATPLVEIAVSEGFSIDSQMGRSRGGKARRPTSQATKSEDADATSGDEEAQVPSYKRRGRPQKHLKVEDDTDEEEEDNAKVEPMEDSDDGAKPAVVRGKGSTENGGKKRRRRRRPSKRGCDSAAEEKDDHSVKQSGGFRHHGSRRKSTPRRAAEAGVECK